MRESVKQIRRKLICPEARKGEGKEKSRIEKEKKGNNAGRTFLLYDC